jgi:hypothetical protein
MRPPLAALLVALLVAGCLEGAPAAPTPASPTPTPTTVTPTPMSTTPPTPGGGMLIRPAHAENASDGFFFEGDESASGFLPPGDVTFSFHEENRGGDAKALVDPCGEGNPRIEIRDANGTKLSLRPTPEIRCMAAMGWGDHKGGAQSWLNFTWNGTSYHGQERAPVPAGRYVVRATFLAQRGGNETDLVLELPVNVLDASLRGVQ